MTIAKKWPVSSVKSYAVKSRGSALEPFQFTPDPLGPEQVEIAVEYCGICHSDICMINNDWGNSGYPLVLGHEVCGLIIATGPSVKNVKIGDRVGLG